MKDEIFLLRKDEIIPLVKQAIKENQKDTERMVIQWITPKQAREYLGIKSAVTLQRFIEENNIKVRYRSNRPDVYLPDLIAYKESMI